MLKKIPAISTKVSEDQAARATLKEKEKTWLAWTLKRIETALGEEQAEVEWLSKWRQESGNAPFVS